jgi:activating signal cointegrator complex subunit 3
VFQHAYNSSENMLVCAPTGAGKTNIATLTILNVIKRYKDNFKVIYISPMKALAGELVQKFTTKFTELKTREMTGDIQLSQKELATTHIIVTTPEKLDVVTRKNTGLMEEVKLVIFDEVHLLNDERGWVLESLVARLFRSVYRTQKTIRIVGLSATLPNYGDVAMFLKVKESGLFHFDSTFRPVPLVIHFYGIKSAADQTGLNGKRRRALDVLNEKCYEFCMKHIKNRKQVLVFTHSRKETSVYCKFIMNRALEIGDDVYLGQADKILIKYKIEDRELVKVAPHGLAFHHAGMKRADRNQVERMFMNGDAKILVATATLAWGVNLPAYAVVIKGTDVYDVNLTESKDLSILDVQQMFGRAGRPQFDTNGEAALMTDFKKVNKYMGALTSTVPIESKFLDFLKEAMNAEICSGTVTNVMEAF